MVFVSNISTGLRVFLSKGFLSINSWCSTYDLWQSKQTTSFTLVNTTLCIARLTVKLEASGTKQYYAQLARPVFLIGNGLEITSLTTYCFFLIYLLKFGDLSIKVQYIPWN